ncbi:MAG: ABC transporter permease [Bacteroidaceae bacterium]|nr:ABC transporter permease [Bacteroidaceae bacterium]
MSKILIIIQREFLTRIQKKSFILLTILMPFIIAGVAVAPLLLASIKDDTQHTVMLVDKTLKYAPLFEDNESYHFVTAPEVLPEFREEDANVKAVILISEDLVENPNALKMYSSEEVPADLQRLTEDILSEKVRADKLASYNVEGLEEIIASAEVNISAQTVKWTDDGGETSSNSGIALGVGFLFTFMIYMFVMSYGGMVMQGVMEEKTNRIMEIIVSSVKPFQLMMGKIIGIALVGFVQIAIWGVMLTAILTAVAFLVGTPEVATPPTMMGGDAAMQTVVAEAQAGNPITEILGALPIVELLIMFVLYFIGGYLLYASFFAAVGASINAQEDSSQFMMPVILIMVFGLYAALYGAENPDGPLAFYASIFPLTSPIVMMVRIPFGVPLWQELLSLALLYASAIFIVWMSGRIYRVGILMYGKKPTVKEILKWIRYS